MGDSVKSDVRGVRRLSSVRGLLVALVLASATLRAQALARLDSATAIDEIRLYKNLAILSADSMEGRMAGSSGGAKARAFLIREFARIGLEPLVKGYAISFSATSRIPDGLEEVAAAYRLGATPRTKSIPHYPHVFGENLVGVVRGTLHPDRYIVVSAHYDHLGMRNGEIYHGADDNASGSAGILAIAEWTAAHPPLNSVIFVWFDGEEEGLLGSEYFVARPPVPLDKIMANVNLDMISRGMHGDLYIAGARRYPVMQPFIDTVTSLGLVNVRQGHEGAKGDTLADFTDRSDQGPFNKKKIPFVLFFSDEHADYHRPTDEAIRINPRFFIGSTQSASVLLRILDGSLDAVAAVRQGGR
jgi:Peptidase family M28